MISVCIDLLQQHLKTPDIVIGADTIVVRGTNLLSFCSIICCVFLWPFRFHFHSLSMARFWRSQWTRRMLTECFQGLCNSHCIWFNLEWLKKNELTFFKVSLPPLLFSSSLSGKEHSVYTGVALILCHEKESKLHQNTGWRVFWRNLMKVKDSPTLLINVFFKLLSRFQSSQAEAKSKDARDKSCQWLSHIRGRKQQHSKNQKNIKVLEVEQQ